VSASSFVVCVWAGDGLGGGGGINCSGTAGVGNCGGLVRAEGMGCERASELMYVLEIPIYEHLAAKRVASVELMMLFFLYT
jgi:hypothetical protein